MHKILLLDWDGPISNSRTWKMPGFVDPVAIQLINDLIAKGWKTVLTSTIRKNFRSEDPQAEATDFMHAVGFKVQWYDVWRTDPAYVNRRHLEFANFLMQHPDIPEDAVFLVVDDEHYPHEMMDRGRIKQIYARSDSGIDYLSISDAYRIMEMSEAELEDYYKVEDEDVDA